jgi:hypothetical protein
MAGAQRWLSVLIAGNFFLSDPTWVFKLTFHSKWIYLASVSVLNQTRRRHQAANEYSADSRPYVLYAQRTHSCARRATAGARNVCGVRACARGWGVLAASARDASPYIRCGTLGRVQGMCAALGGCGFLLFWYGSLSGRRYA